MSEYTEKRTVVEEVPVGSRPVVETRYETVGSRPVVENRYDSVVHERRGMSGVAVAALVVAGITAAVVVVMMIVNSQQRTRDEDLARERASTAAALQQPGQLAQQQPVIVNMPPSQPATVAVPYPVPAPIESAPTSASIEIDVTSRLQNDEGLRPYAIDVKVSGATTTLSGNVPDEDLKKRAEKVAMSTRGVQSIINDITVRP